ncbi:hypothetical protein BN1195_01146 [Chryseobacterium oranimense G311]|uniref:hypothetical protein n=1 Tax=Chryseobacterium oranimense TaxID=421058 RepID=UPI000533A547|nr:hypothetical protein [Chryseobacterium oranimense]CEJ68855.1 hypothetical protein BN1195_01146 [Chryseobacterium oranimense G311]
MKKKLAILILGNRNSGKSNTFYEFFGRVIKTGHKKIRFNKDEIKLFLKNSSFEEMNQEITDDIFVRNSSFEEFGDNVEDYFDENNLPKIILCAVQYKEKGIKTIEYFKDRGYYLYIQWLNPGFKDSKEYEDFLNFNQFSEYGEFHKVSGKEKKLRTSQIKTFLLNFIANNQ